MKQTEDWQRLLEHTAGLWSASVPLRFLGISLGRRMVGVHLPDGTQALLSPAPLPALDQAIAGGSQPPVSALVAPTLFHDTFLAAAARHFPEARVYAPENLKAPGLRERRALAQFVPETGAPLEALPLAGIPQAEETVFHHPAGRLLLVSDLLFSFDERYSLATRLLARVDGIYGGPNTSRHYRNIIKDPRAFTGSLDAVLSRDFAGVIPSHGLLIREGGREALERLRRALENKR
jgi:hypothetical protein